MSRKMRVTLAAFVVGSLVTGYIVWRGQTRHRHRPSKVTSSNRVDWGKLDIRAYPGAQLLRGHTIEDEANFTISAGLHTPDDFGKVARFHKGEYPSPQTISESGGQGAPRALVLTIGSLPDIRDVLVRDDHNRGGTSIMLEHHTYTGAAGRQKAGR